MNKARKRLILFATISVFALLSILLLIINGVNFTVVSEDGDHITGIIAQNNGILQQENSFAMPGRGRRTSPFGGFGFNTPMSPDLTPSLRYFTYALDADRNGGELVHYSISAVSQDEAINWALSLLEKSGSETGWTGITYRCRIYTIKDRTFVTVVDQSRELVPSYRILLISIAGLVLGTFISAILLTLLSRKLYRPLEEAERKQRHFTRDVSSTFRMPLTLIEANTELLERAHGESDETRTILRQVRHMTDIIRQLPDQNLPDEEHADIRFDLTSLARRCVDSAMPSFEERRCQIRMLPATDTPIEISGNGEETAALIRELIENGRKYALSWFEIELKETGGRITIETRNDTSLPDGSLDQVFDRFTRLENAQDVPGYGLGLARVRETVQLLNGRAHAKADGGVFTLTIRL